MADNDESAAEMEERSVTIEMDGRDVDESTADDRRPGTIHQTQQQQQSTGRGSWRRSTDPSASPPTQPQLIAVAIGNASDDIHRGKANPVSVDVSRGSSSSSSEHAISRCHWLRLPDEETAADDIACTNTRQTTKSSGENEVRGPTDSSQEQKPAEGMETSQMVEERKIRETTDILMAAAACRLPYVGSNENPGLGQTVILFDPSKEFIGRGSLTDCMLLENAALSNATAANILLIRNVHQLNSHPLDSVTGSATTLCATKATCSQLALLSNSNVGCQYQLGSVDLSGSANLSGSQTTSSDVMQSSNSRKSDRLRAKPVGWKAWKNRSGDDWVDLQDDLAYNRKRKASSARLPTAQQDEEENAGRNSKSMKLEETIGCHQSVDLDTKCVQPEANANSAKSALQLQSHPVPVVAAAAAALVAASSSVRIYTCTTCNKDFTTEKYLSMHMSLHSGSSYASIALLPSSAGLGGVGGGSGTADLPIRRTKATSPGSMSQWTCKICEKTFAQNSNYKNHIRTHSNERPFVCEICSIGFKERYHLKKHVLFKHTTQLNEKCRFCDKCFKDSTAVRAHERTHSDQRPYACTRCEKTFKTSECLWHHENRSKTCGKSLGELPFQANLVGSGPKPRRGRQTHAPCSVSSEPRPQPVMTATNVQLLMSTDRVQPMISIIHEESMEETVIRQLDVTADWSVASGMRSSDGLIGALTGGGGGTGEGGAAEGRTAAADRGGGGGGGGGVVGVGEETIPAVKVEMEMNIFDYDLTGIATSDSSLEEYCEELEEREDDDDDDDEDASVSAAERTICDEMSGSCYQQQQHLVMQQQQLLLQSRGRLDCGLCGKQCSTQSAYEKHCTVHSEARPHRCDECDIGFKLKVHLKKHNLYRHSDEYPCECSICGKRFKDSSAVRLHERIHSTERPFKCQCGKGFKTRENLWGHRHRGPCDKSEDFLLQNPRVFNSDIGPIWGVPLNMMSAHSMANDIKPQEFSVPTVSHHYPHRHQQQTYPRDILTSLAATSCSKTPPNQKPALASSSQLFKREITTGTTSLESSSSSSASCPSPSIAKFSVSGSRAIAIACSAAAATGGGGGGGGAVVPYPPTAVVVPIKREVVDVSKADGGQSEKCSLPPFETLITTHRPSPLTSAVDSGDLEAATQGPHAPAGPYARPSIADRCPTVQKILLMNGPPAKVRVRLPGIQQLFQTHSAAGTGSVSAAAATTVSDDGCRGIPADLSYHQRFGHAMSSPSPVSTSSPVLPSGTDFVRENTPHRTQKQQQPTNAQAAAGLLYLHGGAEFCLPPPPPYPGLTPSFPSSTGVTINATKPSDAALGADQLPPPSSSCMSVVYWRREEGGGGGGGGGGETFAPPGDDHKNSSALSWQPSSSSSSSEPESLLPADCSISSSFGRV